MEHLLNLIFSPISVTSLFGCILAGVTVGFFYASNIKVTMYNGALFGLIFALTMCISRTYDGTDNAVAYLGMFLLWCVFLLATSITSLTVRNIRGHDVD